MLLDDGGVVEVVFDGVRVVEKVVCCVLISEFFDNDFCEVNGCVGGEGEYVMFFLCCLVEVEKDDGV